MALSIMVKFTKPGRLIAQTSYLGRFKPLKKFGKSFLKSVKVYRRILDLAHCATTQTDPYMLNSVERSRVRKILRRPKECPQSENKKETSFPKQKTTPIIDLFLNPARSEELENILKRRTVSVTRTEVTDCYLITSVFFAG